MQHSSKHDFKYEEGGYVICRELVRHLIVLFYKFSCEALECSPDDERSLIASAASEECT